MKKDTYTLDEISSLADVPKRTLRYYIQLGLMDSPEGVGRGAYYTVRHLEKALEIRKWKSAGLSLERIQEILTAPNSEAIPIPKKKTGDIEVWSKIYLVEGVELHIEPKSADLSPEKLRELSRRVGQLLDELNLRDAAGEDKQ